MYDPSSPMLRADLSGGGMPSPDAKSRFAEDRLLDAVVWCEIKPGEIITEADMVERFGLTRAAARAGLTRLGFDGWAAPKARLGWEVLPISGKLIGDVLEARRIVEPSLAQANLTADMDGELTQIAAILAALSGSDERSGRAAIRHYVDRIDGMLLGAINPLTARHLRKLWHHTARITRFLEDETGMLFRREDVTDLLAAILDRDRPAIAQARLTLIDAHERFFLNRLLNNDAPLTPGSGLTARFAPRPAANDRRDV